MSNSTVQAKTDEFVQSAKDVATSVQEKGTEAATAAQERAKTTMDAAQGKPEPTLMEKTGTQIQNIAQGAVDTVKNTFGAGEVKK